MEISVALFVEIPYSTLLFGSKKWKAGRFKAKEFKYKLPTLGDLDCNVGYGGWWKNSVDNRGVGFELFQGGLSSLLRVEGRIWIKLG